ncbi:hypothetical protein [Celeribacter sp.]|uniref:hypothetical protein n=1 Tax=Celeribacter sp. TaxID=1890673 RepID=UPI003A958D42
MDKHAHTKHDARDALGWHDAAEAASLAVENGWTSSRWLDRMFDALETRPEGSQRQ